MEIEIGARGRVRVAKGTERSTYALIAAHSSPWPANYKLELEMEVCMGANLHPIMITPGRPVLKLCARSPIECGLARNMSQAEALGARGRVGNIFEPTHSNCQRKSGDLWARVNLTSPGRERASFAPLELGRTPASGRSLRPAARVSGPKAEAEVEVGAEAEAASRGPNLPFTDMDEEKEVEPNLFVARQV